MLVNQEVIEAIRNELKNRADPAIQESERRYFKEDLVSYGVKYPQVNRMAAQYYPQIKDLPRQELFRLSEELFRSGYQEEALVACEWTARMEKWYEKEDFDIFERWLQSYVDNWAKCDTLCNHTIGSIVTKYPELVDKLRSWSFSSNRWLRRGAAVTLILPARHGLFLPEVLEIAQNLLMDKDDLVQKGYGWMLKEAAKVHRDEVFTWLMERKAVMPRTSLRYAIEKMPPEMRAAAMSRDRV
jgi:3-methyladenine DNA glycosylase AlkD